VNPKQPVKTNFGRIKIPRLLNVRRRDAASNCI
jgi:hypothetical protein